jgi:hypothetical protein
MTSVVRPVGYVNNLQTLTWTNPVATPVTAYLYGGGGGGGYHGHDGGSGGEGGGGAYASTSFTLNYGDVVGLAVGGGGQPGYSIYGGSAGTSFSSTVSFTTLDFLGDSGVYKYSYGVYPAFLNQYGVWNYDGSFDHSRSINFGAGGTYNISGTCDNEIHVYVDGAEVLSGGNWGYVYSNTFSVSAGYHTVRVVGYNYGGPACIAVSISGGSNYGGGNGSSANTSGAGGGGAGGGATLLFLNNNIIAVAGGGGGGSGSPNNGQNGRNAPGATGWAGTAGQNGQTRNSIPGEGLGGGGGGNQTGGGGNGGNYTYTYSGAGTTGLSYGDQTQGGGTREPGGYAQYRSGLAAWGGYADQAGYGGCISLDFNIAGISVHYNGSFQPVKQTYVNVNGTWRPTQAISLKQNGTWQTIVGSFAPTFSIVDGYFGALPRSNDSPPEPEPYYGGGDVSGYNI